MFSVFFGVFTGVYCLSNNLDKPVRVFLRHTDILLSLGPHLSILRYFSLFAFFINAFEHPFLSGFPQLQLIPKFSKSFASKSFLQDDHLGFSVLADLDTVLGAIFSLMSR